MKVVQTLIKAFAILLAISIIGGLIMAVLTGFSFLSLVTGDEGATGPWTNDSIETEVKKLDINVKATTVRIRKANDAKPVRIETNNEYITSWTDNETLHVVEKSHGVFGWGGRGELVIYIKDGYVFDEAELEVGAGVFDAEKLETKNLRLNLGAGKTTIGDLRVMEKAKIDGGAGATKIENGQIKTLDLGLGVGKADLQLRIEESGEIKCGVGKLDLDLVGTEKDYSLRIDKGLGAVKLDGQDLHDGETWGEGRRRIEIESGVGAVDIRMHGE